MKNQECKVREKIVANKPIFYPFSLKINRCSGSCNNIINPYSKLCVPGLVKKMNLRVFNLLLWKNQTTNKITWKL